MLTQSLDRLIQQDLTTVNLDPLTYELHYVTTGGTGRFARAGGESDIVVVYTSETTWIAVVPWMCG